MQLIHNTISQLRVDSGASFLNLSLFPLVGKTVTKPDYITLREAVRQDSAIVREVSEGGAVPMLLLENRGKRPVLILEGEELIGAKQNRTANVTILAPAAKSIQIPVTCVEAGRWRYTRRNFQPSDYMHFSAGRKSKMASVSAFRRSSGEASADQSEVWRTIAGKSRSMRVDSETDAMSDMYDSHRERVDDYVAAFEPQHGEVGAVFAIGDKVEGMELFDSDQTFAEMLPKLIRSYAIDAIETVKDHRRNPTPDSARDFLANLTRAKVDTYDSVGLGREVRLRGAGIIAGGLVADERVVHLAAFASEEQPSNRGSFSSFVSRLRDRKRNRQSS